ncbi:MAG: SDR family oxidoreductase [Chloroflexi bacterium]|nr:SDR family oxidoreductase [Chloroflexota bacterium]
MNKRTIVVTGAGGALGSLVAKTFSEAGHNLALHDKDSAKLDALVRGLNLPVGRVYSSTVDLTDGKALQASAKEVIAKFGSVHALFHLVGGWVGGKRITETQDDDLEFMINQHVRTTFNLFKAYEENLGKSGWGRVITVSPSSTSNPLAQRSVYVAAKSAQENLVLSLAAELKDANVTANIIQVKAIDVDGSGNGSTPAEIVSAMQYLFSQQADKVTGARIPLS